MKIEIFEKPGAVDLYAAEEVLKVVSENPSCTLGLPTGGTPEGMYSRIARLSAERNISFSDVKTFNLDEYVGLSPDCPQSYHYYMQTNLFDHIDIKQENTNIPDGQAKNPSQACRDYEEKIEQNGKIDLMILGIGVNGHIGFNEPGTFWGTGVHTVELSEETIQANKIYFTSEDDVPKHAMTMGIKNILDCKRIMLLAKGKNKAEIIERLVHSEPTPEIPATALINHPDVTLVIDQKAAEKI